MGVGWTVLLIRILPFDELHAGLPVAETRAEDPLAWAATRSFAPSGRAALDSVLAALGLDPSEDVLITNSSGQTYVSACVTCTVFNHCRPSRVFTERTRAIIVIHEYGVAHPQLAELRMQAQDRDAVLIEDCAHSLDLAIDGRPAGSFGDYAIFSLPKILPVPLGGVIVSNGHELPAVDDPSSSSAAAEAAYLEHAPLVPEYARRRRENFLAVRSRFTDLPVLFDGARDTPFFIGLITPDAYEIRHRSRAVEWGSTLRKDLLLVPTNPLVEPQALVAAVECAFATLRSA